MALTVSVPLRGFNNVNGNAYLMVDDEDEVSVPLRGFNNVNVYILECVILLFMFPSPYGVSIMSISDPRYQSKLED